MHRIDSRRVAAGAAAAALVIVSVAVYFLWFRGGAPSSLSPKPSPGASSAPSPSPSTTSSSTTNATRFGAAFQVRRGESYEQALARTDTTLGHLDLVRVFYPGAPAPWPGKAPGRNVVVSFKLDPAAVLAGQYDDQMRNWFETAPRNLSIYWVYWHEPENDVAQGRFTAEQFRAAFAHLDKLAAEARNPRLKSTLVLMSFTTRPGGGRDWRDYFPGRDVVDVFAWDVYNRPGRAAGGYSTPAQLLDAPRQASESVGKPFAVAELGSVVVPGDDGSRRAAWLRAVGEYCKAHKAAFLLYFDLSWNGGLDDYRLQDAPSLTAWAGLRASAAEGTRSSAG